MDTFYGNLIIYIAIFWCEEGCSFLLQAAFASFCVGISLHILASSLPSFLTFMFWLINAFGRITLESMNRKNTLFHHTSIVINICTRILLRLFLFVRLPNTKLGDYKYIRRQALFLKKQKLDLLDSSQDNVHTSTL